MTYTVPAGFLVVEWADHELDPDVTPTEDDPTPCRPVAMWSLVDANGTVTHVQRVPDEGLGQADVDAATDEHTGTLALVFASLAATLGPVL